MITVVGLGFVGLTTALGFGHHGQKVFCYDVDQEKLDKLEKGTVPFFEPQLEEELNKQKGETIFLTNDLKGAISQSKIIFYCVGTPSMENGEADLSFLKQAIKESLAHISDGDFKTLVIKSTVPPGTTLMEIAPFIEQHNFQVGRNIGLVNNPEFLREGKAFEDFVSPDRIVIGQCDDHSGTILEEIYQPFGAPIFKVSPNTGEFIKYLSNTMLATMISFSNEMSMIADSLGDIHTKDAFRILQLDKRWFGNPGNMTSYVYPGCGFGGSCLPKDTRALVQKAESRQYTSHFLKEVLEINLRIKNFVVNKIAAAAGVDEVIGVLGLAFKPNSDDIRETPSKDIIENLIEKGYKKIIVYDPMAVNNFRDTYGIPIDYADSLDDILHKSSTIVILTAWEEFVKERGKFKNKKVLDFRYMLDSTTN